MLSAKSVVFHRGEWIVTFHPRGARLDLRHTPTGIRVRGVIKVWADWEKPKSAWTVAPPVNDGVERLALWGLSWRGAVECNGYLVFQADGGSLRLSFAERALHEYTGRFVFDGEAEVKGRGFACRTRPSAKGSVAQMADGPADSGLNDSIFDMDRDTVLRLGAETLRIQTRPQRARPVFRVHMEGRPEDGAASVMEFSVIRDYYRSRYAPWYAPINKKRCPAAPTGWMSWNTYFDKAGEKENLDEARVGAKFLKPYGLRVWSIESWQDNSDSQPCRKFSHLCMKPYSIQFPHGMKWLASQIRGLGFTPGLWVVPFGTGDQDLYNAHKKWFLHDAQGKPLVNWCGNYVIDPTNPAARRHVESTLRAKSAEWGYEFFKIDGMSAWASTYSAKFYEQPHVIARFGRPQARPYETFIRSLRRAVGPDRFILACQASYGGPDPSVADGGRVGRDVVRVNKAPDWRNYLSQVSCTL
ncbi:MAG TPA: alpha-galactosidase, partial [Candidatus Brocadiia bacterium]|nr:alpha-galactosidase [Candidatus Brocadiia bacterium]